MSEQSEVDNAIIISESYQGDAPSVNGLAGWGTALGILACEVRRLRGEVESHHEEYEQVCGYQKLIKAKATVAAKDKEIEELRTLNGHQHCITPCDSIRIQQENHNSYQLEKEKVMALSQTIEAQSREIAALNEVVKAAESVDSWFWLDGPSTDSQFKFTALRKALDALRSSKPVDAERK